MAAGLGLGSFLGGMAGGMNSGMQFKDMKERMDAREAVKLAKEDAADVSSVPTANQQQLQHDGMSIKQPQQTSKPDESAPTKQSDSSPLAFIKSLWE